MVASILLVSPLAAHRRALRNLLADNAYVIHEAASAAEAIELIAMLPVAVALCDTDSDAGEWQALLSDLETRNEPPNLIVSCRLADERLWAEVLNLGGYDVLAQPFDPSEVRRVTAMAWMAWHQRKFQADPRRPLRAFAVATD